MLIAWSVGLVVLASISLAVGKGGLAPDEVWRGLTGSGTIEQATIVWDVRVPRTVLAVAVGAALALAGAVLQTLTRNPLADPGILGTTAGAGAAMTIGATLGIASSQPSQIVLAFVGACAAGVVTFLVGRASPLRMVLAGTALSAVLLGLSLGLRLMLPDVLDAYRYWSVGSLAGREQSPLALPLGLVAAGIGVVLLLARQLDALALGDQLAQALGTRVRRVRATGLVVAMMLTAVATAVAGPIVFLGLIAPHLARRRAGASVPGLCGFCLVIGPAVLLASDVVARLALRTGEVPVAVPVAVVGGLMLIWVVRRYGAAAI